TIATITATTKTIAMALCWLSLFAKDFGKGCACFRSVVATAWRSGSVEATRASPVSDDGRILVGEDSPTAESSTSGVPSRRQYLRCSSASTRLHFGQRFIFL